MLQIKNLNVYYGESHILRDVNFVVEPGSAVCLMGRNGVGKTTLLKAIMGLLPAREGSIAFEERDITRVQTFRRARLGIGYVPQGREIIPRLTVGENLLIGLEADESKKTKKVSEEIYDLFPVLYDMLDRMGGDLSGGQQQQLAIARALVAKPKLLILDEPTEGIQPNVIQAIADVITRLRKESSLSILMVEQYLEFALELSDHYYIMSRGSIVSEGKTEDLSQSDVQQHLTV